MSRSERAALDHLRSPSASPQPADVTALLAWADEHVFERRAVAEEAELLTAALRRGHGTAVDLTALRAALAQRDYVRDAQRSVLTARDVLRCELELVFAARVPANHDGHLVGEPDAAPEWVGLDALGRIDLRPPIAGFLPAVITGLAPTIPYLGNLWRDRQARP